MKNEPWEAIFDKYKILKHNFKTPFVISPEQIKKATSHFTRTGEREVRVLCKQDTRKSKPEIFKKNNLFILPIRNGVFTIIKGEGYVDIPTIDNTTKFYKSKLDFKLDTSIVGNSEMQHLDFAYASSLIRSFLKDDSLVLTIRGRKYTPKNGFEFSVNKQKIEVKSVQTEVDAGYEGKKQVVLIEAKNTKTTNVIIRQFFYPFRQWKEHTNKNIVTLFFEKQGDEYSIYHFEFTDENDYNSIKLVRSEKFKII